MVFGGACKYNYRCNLYWHNNFKKILYLAMSGLGCSMKALPSSLRHSNSSLRHLNSSLQQIGSISLTEDRTQSPCIGSQSLSHWTTREVPELIVLMKHYCVKTYKHLLENLYTFCTGVWGSKSLIYGVDCIVLGQHHFCGSLNSVSDFGICRWYGNLKKNH